MTPNPPPPAPVPTQIEALNRADIVKAVKRIRVVPELVDAVSFAVRALVVPSRQQAEASATALREALTKVRAHTAYLPGAPYTLLAGLLASVERIVDAALRPDAPVPSVERRAAKETLLQERERGVAVFIKNVRERSDYLRRQYPHLSSAAVLQEAFEHQADFAEAVRAKPLPEAAATPTPDVRPGWKPHDFDAEGPDGQCRRCMLIWKECMKIGAWECERDDSTPPAFAPPAQVTAPAAQGAQEAEEAVYHAYEAARRLQAKHVADRIDFNVIVDGLKAARRFIFDSYSQPPASSETRTERGK